MSNEDVMQIIVSFTREISGVSHSFCACVSALVAWMKANAHHFNRDPTDVLFLSGPSFIWSQHWWLSMLGSELTPSDSAKNEEIILLPPLLS